MAEGSVWESASVGEYQKLDNLCGIIDVNGLGQSQATQLNHAMDAIAARWQAFGWNAIIVDGHNVAELLAAFKKARDTRGRPTMIVARTLKGKGVSWIEGKDGWHGKALKKGEETDKAIAELKKQFVDGRAAKPAIAAPPTKPARRIQGGPVEASAACLQEGRSRRDARGVGHGAGHTGRRDPRVVALDADVKNSTFSDRFEKVHPEPLLRKFHRRAGDGRRGDGACGARRHPVRVHVCLFPVACGGLHSHGRHLVRQREADRIARRRVDRRGRAVADGARGSRDDARGPELHGRLSV